MLVSEKSYVAGYSSVAIRMVACATPPPNIVDLMTFFSESGMFSVGCVAVCYVHTQLDYFRVKILKEER